jgi:hypothetical protein
MFKILGADGRQYGPVSPDKIRDWIAEGRAGAQTMTQREGETDWKPLSSFPEFAAALAARAPGQPPPRLDAVNADALATEILTRGYSLEIGSCISRGWDLVLNKNNFWLTVGVNLVISLILGVSGAAYVAIIVAGPLMGGLYWFFLKLVRGQQADFEDAFAGFTLAFVQLMLASLVSTVLSGVGFIFCILPGIYLAVAWLFTFPLIIDKQLGFWEAMEVSRKVVTRHWWTIFGLLIVNFFLNLAGALVCCIGALVTMPITHAAVMYAYEDIFGTRPATTTSLAPMAPAPAPTPAAT